MFAFSSIIACKTHLKNNRKKIYLYVFRYTNRPTPGHLRHGSCREFVLLERAIKRDVLNAKQFQTYRGLHFNKF